MRFKEGFLYQIPFAFAFHKTPRFHFLEQFITDGIKIVSSEVIEVRITQNFFQWGLRSLRDLGCHDHPADNFDLFSGEPERR